MLAPLLLPLLLLLRKVRVRGIASARRASRLFSQHFDAFRKMCFAVRLLLSPARDDATLKAGKDTAPESNAAYASSIVKIGAFDSVEGFFGIYDHLVKPDARHRRLASSRDGSRLVEAPESGVLKKRTPPLLHFLFSQSQAIDGCHTDYHLFRENSPRPRVFFE